MADADLSLDRRAIGGTSSSVMGMVIFVASEAMFFMAFLGVYASAYASQPVWPPRQIPLPSLGLPTGAAIVLALSALTMAGALRASARAGGRRAVLWLGATMALGAAFIVLQVIGYQDVGFGIRDGIYASLYYVINAVAVAHVVGGLVLLAMVTMQAASGELALRRDPVRAAAIFWIFVAGMGIVIYVLFFALTG
jgi:heme/copper-type cytochrome/quinol oxidase subunit 3